MITVILTSIATKNQPRSLQESRRIKSLIRKAKAPKKFKKSQKKWKKIFFQKMMKRTEDLSLSL